MTLEEVAVEMVKLSGRYGTLAAKQVLLEERVDELGQWVNAIDMRVVPEMSEYSVGCAPGMTATEAIISSRPIAKDRNGTALYAGDEVLIVDANARMILIGYDKGLILEAGGDYISPGRYKSDEAILFARGKTEKMLVDDVFLQPVVHDRNGVPLYVGDRVICSVTEGGYHAFTVESFSNELLQLKNDWGLVYKGYNSDDVSLFTRGKRQEVT